MPRERNTDCPECGGEEMVFTEGPGYRSVGAARPCSRCNDVGYQMWRHGHRAPDHSCSICTTLRWGSATAKEEARIRLMADYNPAPLDTDRMY